MNRRPTRPRRLVGLVARREVRERVRTRSFAVATAFLALIPSAAIVAPALVHGGGPRTDDVALVGTAPAGLAEALAAERRPRVSVATPVLDDADAARRALRAGHIDAAIVDGARIVVREDRPDDLVVLLRRVMATGTTAGRLREAGLAAAEVEDILQQTPVPVEEVPPTKTVREDSRAMAFIGVLFISLMLLTYGTTITNAVLEEKTSRVSEVLLGALRPHQLLAGKLAGVGAVAAIQLLAVAAACAVALLAVGSELDIPPGSPLTFAAIGMWTILGYGLYACAFAAGGATASRPEEVGNVVGPLNVVIMGSYVASVAVLKQPNGTAAAVSSFLPPMAPMTMLPRAAVGDVAPWEVPVSVALTLMFTYALVKLAGRIYAGGIVRTDARVKLRDAWRGIDG